MNSEPTSGRRYVPLPEHFVLDRFTDYIYRHFSHLLTQEELAAKRVLTGRVKQWAYDPTGNRMLEFFGVPDVNAAYPDLIRRIDECGVASVMRAAAERVLRENPEKKILHNCPKCGELCLTPKAQCCLACGFDWHPKSGE
jgi:hypothetical protein